jgi:arsenate reductase
MDKRVLFVCVGNAGRSQMAEAFARSMGLDASSAGTDPAPAVSRRAVKAMEEVGIDMSQQVPKILDMAALDQFDLTITMGCGVAESCPALHTDEDWGLDDPKDASPGELRRIRDEVKARVTTLANELDAPTT